MAIAHQRGTGVHSCDGCRQESMGFGSREQTDLDPRHCAGHRRSGYRRPIDGRDRWHCLHRQRHCLGSGMAAEPAEFASMAILSPRGAQRFSVWVEELALHHRGSRKLSTRSAAHGRARTSTCSRLVFLGRHNLNCFLSADRSGVDRHHTKGRGWRHEHCHHELQDYCSGSGGKRGRDRDRVLVPATARLRSRIRAGHTDGLYTPPWVRRICPSRRPQCGAFRRRRREHRPLFSGCGSRHHAACFVATSSWAWWNWRGNRVSAWLCRCVGCRPAPSASSLFGAIAPTGCADSGRR